MSRFRLRQSSKVTLDLFSRTFEKGGDRRRQIVNVDFLLFRRRRCDVRRRLRNTVVHVWQKIIICYTRQSQRFFNLNDPLSRIFQKTASILPSPKVFNYCAAWVILSNISEMFSLFQKCNKLSCHFIWQFERCFFHALNCI
jgi:hypothetical protein